MPFEIWSASDHAEGFDDALDLVEATKMSFEGRKDGEAYLLGGLFALVGIKL
jgi:hypothetical protein